MQKKNNAWNERSFDQKAIKKDKKPKKNIFVLTLRFNKVVKIRWNYPKTKVAQHLLLTDEKKKEKKNRSHVHKNRIFTHLTHLFFGHPLKSEDYKRQNAQLKQSVYYTE